MDDAGQPAGDGRCVEVFAVADRAGAAVFVGADGKRS
jgi:hypothetical protein